MAGTGQMQAEAEAASNGETPEGMCRDIKRTGQENPEKIARIYLYSLFFSTLVVREISSRSGVVALDGPSESTWDLP